MSATRLDFDYANARVRARKAELLDIAAYRRLLAPDLGAMLAALGDTPYRPELEAATSRFSGLQLLYETVRTHLARHLRDLADWYRGDRGFELVLGRWDIRNTRTVLRGHFSRTAPDEMRGAIVPAGIVDPALFDALVNQTNLRQAVEALVVWDVPSARVARAVLTAWPEHERSGDLGVLERALERASGAEISSELDRIDPAPAAALRAETDRVNLLTAVRLLAAAPEAEDGVAPAERLRPGGTLAAATLVEVVEAADRDSARDVLRAGGLPAAWRDAVDRWAESGDVVALAGDLDAAVTRKVFAMFISADPLGVGVPTAFVWAKENEARNLRSIGTGISAGMTSDATEERLVIL